MISGNPSRDFRVMQNFSYKIWYMKWQNTVEVTTVLYSAYPESKVQLCCHSLFRLKTHEYLICFDFEILFCAASSIFIPYS